MRSRPIMTRALVYGAVLTVAIAVLGSLIGWAVAELPGLVSALVGAGLTAVFMGLTSVSIIVAERVTRDEPAGTLFFGVVLGMWTLKFILFIAIMLMVRGSELIEPYVLFFSILAAVIGSLAVDVLAFVRARVPYVGDVELPRAEGDDGLR